MSASTSVQSEPSAMIDRHIHTYSDFASVPSLYEDVEIGMLARDSTGYLQNPQELNAKLRPKLKVCRCGNLTEIEDYSKPKSKSEERIQAVLFAVAIFICAMVFMYNVPSYYRQSQYPHLNEHINDYPYDANSVDENDLM